MLPLRDAFAAVFFFAFGLTIDPGDVGDVVVPVLIAVVLSLVLNVAAGLIAARMQGFGRRPAANIGLTILGRGEFSLILATLAAAAGLDARIGPFVAFYVLVLALIAPILASRSRPLSRALPNRCSRGTAAAQAADASRRIMPAWTSTPRRRFVRENHRAILATRRRDGRPQMSPVSVGVDDDGALVISSSRDGDQGEEHPPRSERVGVRLQRRTSTARGCRSTEPPRSCRCPRQWTRSSSTTVSWPASTRTGTNIAWRCSARSAA